MEKKKKSKKLLIGTMIFLVLLIFLKIFLFIQTTSDADYEETQIVPIEINESENEVINEESLNQMINMIMIGIMITIGGMILRQFTRFLIWSRYI